MTYFAHSAKESLPAQEYSDHVQGVYSLVCKYLKEMGRHTLLDQKVFSEVIMKASVYHDLGKLNQQNQQVLSGKSHAKKLPINHVDAGAAYLLDEKHFSVFAASVIHAHHKGYPDFSAEQNKGENAFRDKSIIKEVDQNLSELERIHNNLICKQLEFNHEEIEGNPSVFFRMLLSCLADADHTNTAAHYKRYPSKEDPILLRASERLKNLDHYISELKGENLERNKLRKEMYFACRNSVLEAEISSCDSPVGSGKTTAIMAHLLSQAERRGLRRIFVVLPFTNIIRQSVQTYRNVLVLPGENANHVVAEIHHRADFENVEARHLTALWRAPIIVTTAVAFFETLASNSTATLRRLHELPGSAIFVDEAHAAVPTKLLPISWKWMQVYAKEWNCYWVLASGSLTRFWKIPEIEKLTQKKCVPQILESELRRKLSAFEKSRIRFRSNPTQQNVNDLVSWIAGFPGPRLVILNTIQSAAIIADKFEKRFGRSHVEHISTALTPIDRDKALEKILSRLHTEADEDWTLVATSCVEAGVDISFRSGFRELGSLLSLLQAAGRVNREGLDRESEMWTFCISEEEGLILNPGMEKSAAVLEQYLIEETPITPELSTQSIQDEIALYGLSGKYKKLIDNEDLRNFPWVERNFKVIEADSRIVVVDPSIEKKIHCSELDWQELQMNSVQIAKYKLDSWQTPRLFDDIYIWNLKYDDFLGYMAGLIELINLEHDSYII